MSEKKKMKSKAASSKAKQKVPKKKNEGSDEEERVEKNAVAEEVADEEEMKVEPVAEAEERSEGNEEEKKDKEKQEEEDDVKVQEEVVIEEILEDADEGVHDGIFLSVARSGRASTIVRKRFTTLLSENRTITLSSADLCGDVDGELHFRCLSDPTLVPIRVDDRRTSVGDDSYALGSTVRVKSRSGEGAFGKVVHETEESLSVLETGENNAVTVVVLKKADVISTRKELAESVTVFHFSEDVEVGKELKCEVIYDLCEEALTWEPAHTGMLRFGEASLNLSVRLTNNTEFLFANAYVSVMDVSTSSDPPRSRKKKYSYSQKGKKSKNSSSSSASSSSYNSSPRGDPYNRGAVSSVAHFRLEKPVTLEAYSTIEVPVAASIANAAYTKMLFIDYSSDDQFEEGRLKLNEALGKSSRTGVPQLVAEIQLPENFAPNLPDFVLGRITLRETSSAWSSDLHSRSASIHFGAPSTFRLFSVWDANIAVESSVRRLAFHKAPDHIKEDFRITVENIESWTPEIKQAVVRISTFRHSLVQVTASPQESVRTRDPNAFEVHMNVPGIAQNETTNISVVYTLPSGSRTGGGQSAQKSGGVTPRNKREEGTASSATEGHPAKKEGGIFSGLFGGSKQ